MKMKMLFLASVLACSLCGCASDEVLIASASTKPKATNTNPDGTADAARDLANEKLSAASKGSLIPRDVNSGALQQGNPYSH